jgi:hypothetical protein
MTVDSASLTAAHMFMGLVSTACEAKAARPAAWRRVAAARARRASIAFFVSDKRQMPVAHHRHPRLCAVGLWRRR